MSRPTRLLRLRLAAPLALFLLLPSVLALGATDVPETVLDVSGLTFVGSRGTQNELVLRAERARFHPERNTAQLEQVHAVVQREGEAPGFEITCDRADLDLDTNDFRAEGNVHGSTADGRRFRSDWVKYASESGVLSTEAPVTIEEGGGTLRGGGFRFYVKEQRFRLLGGATLVQEP